MDQNPYSHPQTTDIIKDTINAEPEKRYDWNFAQLPKDQQEAEILNQQNISSEIYKRLSLCIDNYAVEFSRLPKEFIYDCLFRVIFQTTDLSEIGQKFSQTQRRDYQLLIVNFIEEIKQPQKPTHNFMLSKIAVVIFFIGLSSFFCIQINTPKTQITPQVLGTEVKSNYPEDPLYLIISTPSVNINTIIQPLGVTQSGNMDVPSDITKVGWFDRGPRPGEKGNAVIAGHLNGPNNAQGVFANLDKLKIGDKIFVGDSQGTLFTFVVRDSRAYNPGYAEDVFSSNSDSAHLNLVTCDGTWDKNTKSYTKRLVVFTDIVK